MAWGCSLKPESSHLKPERSRLKPESSHLKPESSCLKPESSCLKPENSRLKPESSHLKPESSRLKPESSRLKPENSRLKPESSRLKPEISPYLISCTNPISRLRINSEANSISPLKRTQRFSWSDLSDFIPFHVNHDTHKFCRDAIYRVSTGSVFISDFL
ncbi:MAG: hypothetical protein KME28_08105 [Pelatocladus maniniholoensis HA4357-MV3]|jgi:FtsZ-binding cell division protein ZapB|uniref:Uncharacterized protein n=1 Tax=Pelatocladus maniniholoensis HA4357-MV3 TaxID=1117104 RepID=A0A9E3H6I7_9NOST|nr:hypothetical protein [Pelatocladus maniniholoensis HA4357-MV3]